MQSKRYGCSIMEEGIYLRDLLRNLQVAGRTEGLVQPPGCQRTDFFGECGDLSVLGSLKRGLVILYRGPNGGELAV